MDFEVGIEIIDIACKADYEKNLFMRWIHGFQFEMSFEEFMARSGRYPKNDELNAGNETADEILAKVKGIMDGDI